jgi:ribosomal protein L11 methyltransferase
VPERWLQVRLRSPSGELAAQLAEGLLACGGSAVEERDGELITYLPLGEPFTDADDAVRFLRGQLGRMLGVEPPEFVVEDVPDEDWLALWREGLAPRQVGERIIVAPTWSDVAPGPDQLLIRIDPQMAFGTGEHATTRGVLRLAQQVVRPGDRLLDVGTGSGILAIAGALLGAAHVAAVENDPEAMENAAENIERNGADEQVALLCAHVDDAFLDAYGGGAFDGIFANVLSSVLVPLLPAFHRALARDGWAILSGILAFEADTVKTAAADAGFIIEAEDAEEQWWSVLLRR